MKKELDVFYEHVYVVISFIKLNSKLRQQLLDDYRKNSM